MICLTEQEVLQKIDIIEQKVAEQIKDFFPLDLGTYILDVTDIEFNRPKLFDINNEIALKDNGSSLNGTVSGTFQLIGKSDGKVKKKEHKRIATIPYLTNRGTYIIGGNEKVITKQMLLKPGVYTFAEDDNTVRSFAFLEKGKNFKLSFDTENKNLTLELDTKTFNAITFLYILGATRDEIINAIGDLEISNPLLKKSESKNLDNEVIKIWTLMPSKIKSEKTPGKVPPIDVAIDDIRKYFFDVSDFGETGSRVMNMTLGHASRHPDKQVFLNAISKLMRIAKTENPVERDAISDDRDDIRFQNIMSDEDQISFYVRRGLNENEAALRASIKEADKGAIFSRINATKVSGELTKFMSKGSLVDQVEQTNPLLMSAALRKLTSLGERGLSSRAATSETRNLQNTAFGKIDPVETPESGKIGLVTHVTSDVDVKNLTIESKYYPVVNGKFLRNEKNIVRLSPLDEYDKYIAFYDVNAVKAAGDTVQLPNKVMVRYQGNIIEVPKSRVEYIDTTPHAIWGDATRIIPFSAHNDGNRMLMGSNMQKQALILQNREAPLVQNAMNEARDKTYEEDLAEKHAFVVKSDVAGTVDKVNKSEIVVKDNKGTDHTYKLMNYFPLNMGNYINNTPTVNVGDKVSRGQLLAEGWQTRGGVMAHGINARIAYMPWKGFNYEDGYVVSESFAKKMGTEELKEIVVDVSEGELGGKGSKVKPLLSQLNVPAAELAKLDDDGIIREGSKVGPGTVLVGKVIEDTAKDDRPEYRLLRAMGTEVAKAYKNKSSMIEGYINGEVIRVKKIPGEADAREAWKVTILMHNPLREGDKIAGRHVMP
jgi:DNA-directed RNA polymerase subunit beta